MGDFIVFTIRIDDIARRKLKIMAGYEDISINALISGLIDEKIEEWEKAHGEIEIPKK